MTLQEIFNKVWERAKDKEIATSDGFNCMYRAPNGKSCFIGVLIPDDKYNPKFERKCLLHVLEAIGIDNSLLNACSILQQIHDGTPPHDWGFYLREFAANNNLIVPA